MYDIEVKDVTVRYGAVTALSNVNLKVKNKQFLGIIGPNGGGKTTLLKVLLGLIEPDTGEVQAQHALPIGYVPQFTIFDKGFPIKVIDVVLMGSLYGKIKWFHRHKKKDIQKAEKIMHRLGILAFRNRQIGQLSGGQMQKVLIARALLMAPKVLILDEPTASIDANATSDIYRLLKDLNKDMTIIIVSHDIGVVSSYIDSVACINKTLHYHGDEEHLTQRAIEATYGCPVDLIGHGHTPHRVFRPHEEGEDD